MKLEAPLTPRSEKRRLGVSTVIAIATAVIITTGCYYSLLFIDFEDPSPPLWPVYLPPVLLTVVSLMATLTGHPLPKWISRSIFAGTVVFWVGVALFSLLLVLWMMSHPL